MADTFEYDVSTDRGLVRLLISDVGGASGDDFLFNDAEIDAFLTLEDGAVYSASAVALRAVAGNEVQVSKVIKFLEVSTNGAAVAKSLLDLADTYEVKAEEIGDGSDGFEIATMAVDARSEREIIRRELGL